MLVELDPEILAIFQASTSVSGKYFFFLSRVSISDSFFHLQSTRASARISSRPRQSGAAARRR